MILMVIIMGCTNKEWLDFRSGKITCVFLYSFCLDCNQSFAKLFNQNFPEQFPKLATRNLEQPSFKIDYSILFVQKKVEGCAILESYRKDFAKTFPNCHFL